MCMRVEFHQRKNGLSAFFARSMKSSALAVTSSSIVSMRFFVSGPVSAMRPSAKLWMTPRGPNFFLNSGLLRVVGILRLLLGVQVVEVAEELVEAVVRGQHLVAVAEVVLAELAGHVALRLEQRGDRRVFLLHALGRARQADLGEAGADGRLPGDERRAAGGAALLAVPVGEERAFLRDAVDVRRLVAHHALVVGADVEAADVVAPDDEDVGLLRRRSGPGPAMRLQARRRALPRARIQASSNGSSVLLWSGTVWCPRQQQEGGQEVRVP